MKTYEEMIQWHVNQVENTRIRYNDWPSYLAIAEVYELTVEKVVGDINQEKEHRASNEARRIANLARN